MMASRAVAPSSWAQGMGYAGLLPFVVLATATWVAEAGPRAFAALALAGYGAVIASFLGAIHWGLVMREASKQWQVHEFFLSGISVFSENTEIHGST